MKTKSKQCTMTVPAVMLLMTMFMSMLPSKTMSFSLSTLSSFHGSAIVNNDSYGDINNFSSRFSPMTMRKQKASDRRTRRRQRGNPDELKISARLAETMTSSPMSLAQWSFKSVSPTDLVNERDRPGGRGRSRKRATLYNSLSSYNNKFLELLTAEYRAEENEVLNRIKSSVDNPLALEAAGFALFDMYPERRGNVFSDEIYRITRADDATVSYNNDNSGVSQSSNSKILPPHHKFSVNDVIVLSLQREGSGDFFDVTQLPGGENSVSIDARITNVGPTYIDFALAGGEFEKTFGPAPNNEGPGGRGDPKMRLRADLFFSDIPYRRMVTAITQLTAIPENKESKGKLGFVDNQEDVTNSNPHDNIRMDDVFKEAFISTHAFNDPNSPLFHDMDACNLQDLGRRLSKPPMPTSVRMANQVLKYIQSNPNNLFNAMNGSQLAAIGAALSRKLTMIQGPPGTGKTTVASAIGFGFVHQCRTISPNAKVLACAFSNIGADNLVEGFMKLGLKVVRVGKVFGVSESLWDYTLEAAIHNDPDAQKALRVAARATSELARYRSKGRKGSSSSNGNLLSERDARNIASAAVKAANKACNVAAVKALRQADIIVSTSVGAADPRLMAACGLAATDDNDNNDDNSNNNNAKSSKSSSKPFGVRNGNSNHNASGRKVAPDGLPPLSLPFVIVDEACQSVEPATLIPITASDSCRSLVLLGDPCQLPPTVKGDDPNSELTVSLMERLAATLPVPATRTPPKTCEIDASYIDSLPIKQARSYMHAQQKDGLRPVNYRKRFSGSLLLGVQYRMHPSISAFPSTIFYDGLLATPATMQYHREFPRCLDNILPCSQPSFGLRMVNIGGRCNERRGSQNRATTPGLQESSNTSYSNEAEAIRVVDLVKQIFKHGGDDVMSPQSIGIVTPYSGQVQLIKTMLSSDKEIRTLSAENGRTSIEVKSVDGYQGRERDVIIFSAVRSNRSGNVGFLSDWRRMNVALTRAKSAIIVIGDMDTLAQGDKHWAAFKKFCEGNDCIINQRNSNLSTGGEFLR